MAVIGIILFLFAVLAYYQAHNFQGSVFLITKIVVIEGSVCQIYTCSWYTGYYTTCLLVAIITLAFSKIQTGRLRGCFCQKRLALSQLGLVFFFWRFGGLFFYVRSSIFPTISIHFSNPGCLLKGRYRFSLNSFIKYFIP